MAEISKESAREKNIRHGHPSTLHIWWARRPLASSRATNFSALIDLPEDEYSRKKINELIKNITPWESVKDGNNKYIEEAKEMIKKKWNNKPPRVLDPFSGGGSIPMEAMRLGYETYSSDYNPVAVFIEKGTIEWPKKFGILIPHPNGIKGIDGEIKKVNFLKYMVERWIKKILELAEDEIGKFYPLEPDGSIPMGFIWVRTITCQNPNCGANIPLIRQFWLSKKDNKKIAYKPIVDSNDKSISYELMREIPDHFDPSQGTISRSNAKCPVCHQITLAKEIRKLSTEGKMNEKMAIVVSYNLNKIGKQYRLATEKDFKIFQDAKQYLDQKTKQWKWLDKPIPNEELPYLRSIFNVNIYGITEWQKLFNPRQKLAIVTLMEKIKSSYEEICKECKTILKRSENEPTEAANAVVAYLAIMLDMHCAFNNRLARWENTSEAIKHLFGRQALGMMWDYIEVSPFSKSSGTPYSGLQYYLKNIEFGGAKRLEGNITISMNSATSLPYPDNYFDAIFTDPPYYDNIPYADLSDFFYVWLKRCIGDIFPELFSTPLSPKNSEIVQLAERNKKYAHKTKDYFEEKLTQSFCEITRTLKPDGIATIVYAHKTTEGWETLLNSLIKAGLVVTASWPIHTEMKVRLRAKASAALASSIYIVCRKTEREPVGFFNEIKPNIIEKIEEKLQQFWNEGIAGGDFFISAIGPSMEIFSKYERVEKLSGGQVSTLELLDFIRSVSTDFIVQKLLKNTQSTNIDRESDFYLAYRWTYLDNTVEFDDARKLASASGINLEKYWSSDGFIKKSGSKISVLGPKERDNIDKTNSMVDVMHKAVLFWEKGEKEKLTQLLAETGYGKDPAFKQFCQAVAESLLNGNKEKQLLEGFLIGIDSYQKAKVKIGKDQTDLSQYGGS